MLKSCDTVRLPEKVGPCLHGLLCPHPEAGEDPDDEQHEVLHTHNNSFLVSRSNMYSCDNHAFNVIGFKLYTMWTKNVHIV